MRRLRPSAQPSAAIPSRKGPSRAFVAGSSSARPVSTPTRRMPSLCPQTGRAAPAATRPAMKSARFITRLVYELSGLGIGSWLAKSSLRKPKPSISILRRHQPRVLQVIAPRTPGRRDEPRFDQMARIDPTRSLKVRAWNGSSCPLPDLKPARHIIRRGAATSPSSRSCFRPDGTRFAPLDISPKRKREHIPAALLRQLEGLAWLQPVLMIFEDWNWIDPTSREALSRSRPAPLRPEGPKPPTSDASSCVCKTSATPSKSSLCRHDTASVLSR
jgi:hypothetical protein